MPDQPDLPYVPPHLPSAPPVVPPAAAPPSQPAPPPPTGGEVLMAGCTRHDDQDRARGFAAGGELDQMDPGPVLARHAAGAITAGLGTLDDDELTGLLCAARRLSSWTASIEVRAVSQLDARRRAYAATAGDLRQAQHVGDEVAAALTLTCRAADRLISFAAGITRLPAAAAALAAGRIDMPRAIIFTDELAGLGDVEAAAVAALVAADAPGLTTGQLRGVLHRAVLALDPDAARKRREKAQKDARVECWTEPAGTWSLAGRDMPPAYVLAADKHIDAAARDLKATGAGGTLEQLRSRVFLALLSGRPLYTLLPGQDGDAGGTTAARQDDVPADPRDEDGDAGDGDGDGGNGPGSASGGPGAGQDSHGTGPDGQDGENPGPGDGDEQG